MKRLIATAAGVVALAIPAASSAAPPTFTYTFSYAGYTCTVEKSGGSSSITCVDANNQTVLHCTKAGAASGCDVVPTDEQLQALLAALGY
jgi:hypothetical protein